MRGLGEAPRLLLVRLSAIGDCLHALPLVESLRKQLPAATIDWAIERPGWQLVKDHPAIDEFHLFPRRARGIGALRELSRFRRTLRRRRYDVAIDVQGLTKSGVVAWMSGAAIRVGFGGPESRELNRWFVNRRIDPPAGALHVIERNLSLLTALSLAPGKSSGNGAISGQVKELPPYDAPRIDAFLSGHGLGRGDFVVVNPGAGWPTKEWPPDRLGELASAVEQRWGLVTVVTWAGEREKEAAARIVRAGDSGTRHLAPATDLRELGALLQKARFFVGLDTGPAHLAAALQVPTFAIFGPTDPARNGPYGPLHRSVTLDTRLDCQFCWKSTCERGDQACLTQLPVGRVFEALVEWRGLLESTESGQVDP